MERKEAVTHGLQQQGCVWLYRSQHCVGVRWSTGLGQTSCQSTAHLLAAPEPSSPFKRLFLSPCTFALSHLVAHPFCTHTSHLPFFSHSDSPFWCLDQPAQKPWSMPHSPRAHRPCDPCPQALLWAQDASAPACPGAGWCGRTTQQQAPRHVGAKRDILEQSKSSMRMEK